ncbi:RWD domain-containing protein 3 isoform X2 [Rhinatrema bivittatum]|uniref:RWD domain-containing protein 3 isoform X2 n=1 Tax=Rhinatrema bivittatum TaxID=194408 RepID=UPI001128BD44|nr:RWD domain-containing protein 3 isoform X2 [Rhinatrema bivittatum]XP_029474149.1 RWD domain-containing protein 3 isoform X2 [Rhinatrema bivittatum]
MLQRKATSHCTTVIKLGQLFFRSETDGITFRIQTSVKGFSNSEIRLKLTFHLPVTYPSCLPNISVSSEELTRAQCKNVKDKLLERANELLSEPMIHELLLWMQQNPKQIIEQSETYNSQSALPMGRITEDDMWMVLLHLDHMRAKVKYVRTVEKWTSDLELTGRLMFMGKMILILLQGNRKNIKDYLIIQKTSKVDVDSCGKKCKEKMIRVLCETRVPTEHKRFLAFEVKDYASLAELQKEFEAAGLGKVFTEFVIALL